MKDSLFEMLLSLFEKTLTELKESHISTQESFDDKVPDDLKSSSDAVEPNVRADFVRSVSENSLRVFTYDEQMKLTKASYQFLMRMLTWKIIHPDEMELIINQLIFSESRIVTLEETKWTIRNVLSETLDAEQIAFLDLVLYQKEDEYTLH